jgi:hypothetical protein
MGFRMWCVKTFTDEKTMINELSRLDPRKEKSEDGSSQCQLPGKVNGFVYRIWKSFCVVGPVPHTWIFDDFCTSLLSLSLRLKP